MIRWLVAASLQARYVILAAALAVVVFGAMQFDRMPVDALPEFAPPTVEVQTEAIGLSAEEVESLITIGLEELLSGVPWLESTRSASVTGLSTITLQFKRGTDIVKARQMVQERLVLDYKLPNVATPPVILQPVSTTNRFMMIGLSSDKIDATELSLLARWTIKPRLIGVPGVANVSIWGQRLRQLHVQIHPERLRDARVVQDDIIAAAGDALWVSPLTFLKSSAASPGGWFDNPSQRIGVEHKMPIETPEDMAKIPVTPEPELRLGRALPLGDVAELTYSHAPVIGDATVNGGHGLLLVLERFPSTSVDGVTRGVDQALHELERGLPGIKVDASVFRLATYVDASVTNARNATIGGIVLAFVVALLMFRSWRRAAIIATGTIVSLLAAVAVLEVVDATRNVMMLAGLALAVAVIVDGIVGQVMAMLDNAALDRGPSVDVGPLMLGSTRAVVVPGLVALLVVVPVLAMRGTPGAFVQPFAIAFALAMIAALVVAATFTPAIALLLRPQRPATSPHADRWSRLSDRTMAKPQLALAIAMGVVAIGIVAAVAFGHARIPALDGTTLVAEWSAAPGTSQIEMQRITARAARELQSIAGVKSVGAHIGRAVTGDRIVGSNDAELWIGIDPAADRRATIERVNETLAGYPGIRQSINGYLDRKVADVAAGSDKPVTVRVYGPRRDVRLQMAGEIQKAIATIPGIVDPQIEGQAEEPQVQVRVDLDAASRADVKPGDVRRASATIFSGIVVGYLFKEQKIFEVVVWGAPETRASLANLGDVWIDKADRTRVRLKDVAQVSFESTPTVIRHERIAPYIDVVAGVSSAPLREVRGAIDEKLRAIRFPLEHRPEIVGESPGRERDRVRAIGIGIAAIVGLFLLLEAFLGSFRVAAAGFVTVLPVLAVSALVALVTGGLSMASMLGAVAVVAIASRHAMTMLDRLQSLEPDDGRAGVATIGTGAATARHSIVASTTIVVAAMTPLALMTGRAGVEILGPMAIVAIAGTMASAISSGLLLPALYLGWRPARRAERDPLLSPEA